MKNIFDISKLLTNLSALFGFLYICLILWSRLILQRLPKDLDGNYTSIQFISFCFLFFISFLILCINLKKLLNIKFSTNSIYNKILSSSFYVNIVKYILEAPKNLYHWLLQYIVIRDPIENLGIKIWNMDPYKYNKTIIFAMYFLRIFVSIVFIIDIFYFNKLEYLYKILIIILIPITFQGFLYIIKDFSKWNKEYIEEEFLIIEPNENRDGFYAEPKETYKHFNDNQILSLSESWTAYLANCMFVDKCYEIQDIYNKYISIIIYSIYSIGWGYIIFITF